MTLVELLVVLVVLAVWAGIAAFAFRPVAPIASDPGLAIRASAIRAGYGITAAIEWPGDTNSAPVEVRFLPDGRAIGPGYDPLTGRPAAASEPPRGPE